MYTFIKGKYISRRNKNTRKSRLNKRYIFTFILQDIHTGERFFGFNIERNTHSSLFNVIHDNFNLSKIHKVYCDGNISYDRYFGDRATCAKSYQTNVIENLNSQLRDTLAGLVRKTKGHYKRELSMRYDLETFFNDKNLF